MTKNNKHNDAEILDKTLLADNFVKVIDYKIRPKSMCPTRKHAPIMQRDILHLNDAIVVLIYAPKIDSFVMTQEFRAGVFMHKGTIRPHILATVAGFIESHNSPEETAFREVKEETGLTPQKLDFIASPFTCPGRMTERLHIYLATIEGSPKSGIFGLEEEAEEIKTKIIPRKEAYSLMDKNKIHDTATLLALNWFRARNK